MTSRDYQDPFGLLSTKPKHPNCPEEIEYGVKGLTAGITYDANKALLRVDTSIEIPLTKVKYTVKIGLEERREELEVEVFDCISTVDIVKYFQA